MACARTGSSSPLRCFKTEKLQCWRGTRAAAGLLFRGCPRGLLAVIVRHVTDDEGGCLVTVRTVVRRQRVRRKAQTLREEPVKWFKKTYSEKKIAGTPPHLPFCEAA